MINYKHIEEHCLDGLREQMQQTQQDAKFHGEGDVFTHTKMVCDALDVSECSEREIAELRIAALLHDIGKIRTTQINGDDITTPNHSIVGARMTREILWKKFGLAGTKEALQFRETIVNLVRYHGLPIHAYEDDLGRAKMHRAAMNKLLGAYDFTMDKLYRLAKADMIGRICQDKDNALTAVDLFKEMAESDDILYNVIHPVDMFNTHKFLNFKAGNCKHPSFFDDTQCEVVMLCGLPGTGKDTYISKAFYKDWSMISLDEIRSELNIKPGSKIDGQVIQTAKHRAKMMLRLKRPFIWNATNLTLQQRSQLIDLFETYKARVFIDYLETTPEEQKRRNHNRDNVVPEETINDMIGKLVLPEFFEAQYVSWNIV